METIYLGGGCFWCVEAIYKEVTGITNLVSGYMGGHTENPTYKDICTGTTNHAEVVEVTFDPKMISLEMILKIFFTTHDPTTLNRQGNDKGTQYRSVIFCTNDQQLTLAKSIASEFAPTIWDDPIVTEIDMAPIFYPGEVYHQDYFARNSYAPYCQYVINPKVAKFRKQYRALMQSNTTL